MKRWVGAALILTAGFWTTTRGQQSPTPPGPEYVPGEILVHYGRNATIGRRDSVLSNRRARLIARLDQLDVDHVQLAAGESVETALSAFRGFAEVASVQPNYVRHAIQAQQPPPNDPKWLDGSLYGLVKIQAQGAWNLGFHGDGTVVVADIDTGINYNHQDLIANVWTNPGEIAGDHIDNDHNGFIDDIHGIDTVNGDSDPIDDNGHGTHTAGTIAAVGNNGIGVVGVNWNAKVLSCKFLNANGSGSDAGAAACLNYIVDLKQNHHINIRVTNNSWGGYGGNPSVLQTAFEAAYAAGIISFAAAGNDNLNIDSNVFYPASLSLDPLSGVVAVASSDSSDNKSSFSNYGVNTVSLAAPGSSILSTYTGAGNNVYATLSGTSMATPHVAGTAALLSSMDPTLNVDQLKAIITGNVDVLPAFGGITVTGGRLNAFKAASTVGGGPPARTNVALASNGGVASASSIYATGFGPTGANNGDRRGLNWGNNGGWADGTANVWPDWLEIDFAAASSINEIDVFTIQDNAGAPVDPTPTMTFTQWGIRDFEVQYWTGAAWQDVPGGTITGNNLVWRQVTFGALTTTKIRVLVNNALAGSSRLAEVEAWTPGGGNQPPSATLTGPANNSTYTAPATVQFSATASDPDAGDTIDHVTFYANGNPVGTSTVPVAGTYNFSWTNVAAGTYTLTAVATDNHGLAGAPSNGVTVTVNPLGGARMNVALASSGGVASASSTFGSGFGPTGANNGDRRGLNWGNNGGWADGTANVWPDWLEIDFASASAINEVDVFTIQDNAGAPVDPTPTMTFTQWGIRDFEVQYWTGSAWQDVPGGAITGNNLVWRQVTFGVLTTTKIRVLVNNALAGNSRLAEVEAWTPGGGNQPPSATLTGPANNSTYTAPATVPLSATASDPDAGDTIDHVTFYANGNPVGTSTVPVAGTYSFSWTNVTAGTYTLTAVATDNHGLAGAPSNSVTATVNSVGGRMNVALASNGGVASASSIYATGFGPTGANNGDRLGLNWGNNGGWADGTANVWPDWLEIDFAAASSINEVDVFTIQDNAGAPVDPTPTMTFTQWGIRDFEVQYWTGSAWQDVPGGAITGNNLVWRQVTFGVLTTTKIRVLVNNALAGNSRLAEVEAWTPGPAPDPAPADTAAVRDRAGLTQSFLSTARSDATEGPYVREEAAEPSDWHGYRSTRV